MKPFVDYHKRSQRIDPDWSKHYVDYGYIKKILRAFSKRRERMGTVVKGEGYVTRQDLAILDSQVQVDFQKYASVRKLVDIFCVGDPIYHEDNNMGDYFKFFDEGEGEGESSDQLGVDEALHRLAWLERTEFCELLDKEVEKAASFYGTLVVSLAEKLNVLSRGAGITKIDTNMTMEEGNDAGSHAENDDSHCIVSSGDELLETLAFVVVNMITIRQSLIRYDAFIRTFDGTALENWYLKNRRWDDSSGDYFQHFFHMGEITSLHSSFTMSTRIIVDRMEKDRSNSPAAMHAYLREFNDQYCKFTALLGETLHSVVKSTHGRVVLKDRLIANLRYYFLLGSQKGGLSHEPRFLLMRGKDLKKEIKAVVAWREKGKIGGHEGEKGDSDIDILPLALNLISCFLTTMGAYIVEPSSAYYVSALGANEAMAGVVVGAKQWATLFSAVGYSYWTTYSYKTPLLFAAFLLLIGNLLYAIAYNYKSIEMCILGRFVAGLGATRTINSRYIADTTPVSIRTGVSAAFGLSKALGAATGPGLAVILDMLDFEFYLPFLGKQYFNGMTGPGYLLVLLWLIFIIIIAFAFHEPKRIGLDELLKKEELASSVDGSIHIEDSGAEPQNPTEYKGSDEISQEPRIDKEEITFNNRRESSSSQNCFKHMTRAVLLCMLLIFCKRVALDSIVVSTSLVTKNRYGWTIKNVGLLHCVNGMIVIPITMLAGWQSQFYEDRYLTVCYLLVILMGLLVMLDFTDFVSHENEGYNEGQPLAVGPARYIIGSLIGFSGIEACECFVSSLMSKVMPSALASGTFNSGLLTTLVSVGGGAAGGSFITLMGLISIRNLLNLLIVPAIIIISFGLTMVRLNYHILAV